MRRTLRVKTQLFKKQQKHSMFHINRIIEFYLLIMRSRVSGPDKFTTSLVEWCLSFRIFSVHGYLKRHVAAFKTRNFKTRRFRIVCSPYKLNHCIVLLIKKMYNQTHSEKENCNVFYKQYSKCVEFGSIMVAGRSIFED